MNSSVMAFLFVLILAGEIFMLRGSVLITQILFVIISAVFFFIKPVLETWINVTIYVIAMALIILQSQKKDRKQLSSLQKEIAKSKEELNRLNFEVQVASSQVASVSEQLNITLDENNSFTHELFNQTRDMADLNTKVNENINNTISAVRNLIEMLEEGGNTSVQLKAKSSDSNEVIKNSLGEIMEIVDTINHIRESSDESLKHIEVLTHTSGEIANMLEMVNNIAKQTHLLSLNASIESARAGETGKGFAVVADEIRKLALDSSQAVKDVGELIENIQVQVDGVNAVVRKNSDSVTKGVAVSKNIEDNLEKINISFDEVLKMIDRISVLAQQEVKLTKEVGGNIEVVEHVIHRTSESVNEVYDSVHKQKNNIEDIAHLGGRLDEASKSLVDLMDTVGIDNIGNVKKDKVDAALEAFRGINQKLEKDHVLTSMDKEVHDEIFRDILKRNDFIEAIWSNDVKGRFICSIPNAGIANGTVREWFKKAVKGEEYVSEPYISAITKNPCLTISTPIKNEAGSIIGVIGIDIKL